MFIQWVNRNTSWRIIPCCLRESLVITMPKVTLRDLLARFYGDEERGIPASELYSDSDALEAIDDAQFVLQLCRELISSKPGG